MFWRLFGSTCGGPIWFDNFIGADIKDIQHILGTLDHVSEIVFNDRGFKHISVSKTSKGIIVKIN